MSSSIIAILSSITIVVALPAPQLVPRFNVTNHGDPNLSCTPTKWSDIASFFLGNYFAHAATVRTYPGEGSVSTILAMLGALLLPTSGLLRGLSSIMRLGTFYGREFSFKALWKASMSAPDCRTAAASGSLCMLVRKPNWQPRGGEIIKDIIARNRCLGLQDQRESDDHSSAARIERPSTAHSQRGEKVEISGDPEPEVPRKLFLYKPPWAVEQCSYWEFSDSRFDLDSKSFLNSRTIHGKCDLNGDEFYTLATVPRDAKIQGVSDTFVVSSSYNFPSALIAVLQFTYATVTLVQTTRGAQIDTYGYATFGLTVIPYAMMSLVNLISALTTPSYSTMFMVRNEVMDEAIAHGAKFDGVVGRLCPHPLKHMDIAIVNMPNNSPPLLDSTQAEKSTPLEKSTSAEDPTSEIEVAVSEPHTPIRISLRNEEVEHSSHVYTVLPPEQGPEPNDIDDTSPSFFIPACSRFQRSISYSDKIDETRLRSTQNENEYAVIDGQRRSPRGADFRMQVVILVNGLIIIAILGGLTHFRKEQSTNAQRSWLMIWYILGIFSGVTIEAIRQILMSTFTLKEETFAMSFLLFGIFIYGIPSIGGFVVVGQMLWNYGVCIEPS